jgi:ADP-heptose:LPS heptosyltransferase
MSAPKQILLVHFYSNGDALYATAIARQIKVDFPGCHLTWAIASNCKNIIANNPYIDAIVVADYVHCNDRAVFADLWKRINPQDFDQVFITHPSYLLNNALYDGCIRSNVFRAYPNPVTVPVTPVLELTQEEKARCAAFAAQHR